MRRLVWRYVKSLAGAGELYFKALVLGARGRRGRKILPVNAATAPAELTGSAQNEIEETRRTARIKMGIGRSEEHTSELQSLMRISYAVFCLKKKTTQIQIPQSHTPGLTYTPTSSTSMLT